ncbi:hypothetical protein Pmani_016114 [Petrolisthes manimaculis]|uniref:Uncharacterized protein n=1 Tax=Petrolisthes manimaculis TaxID=1843537 RepID=A0AAE1PSK2_9EUCA|nr:hypothetical protein Pmani_016114 [Petrolisthes manimaculis]
MVTVLSYFTVPSPLNRTVNNAGMEEEEPDNDGGGQMRAAKSLIVVKSVPHHDGVGSGCSCGVAAQARQYGRLARYGRNADPLVSTVTPQAKHVVWFEWDPY